MATVGFKGLSPLSTTCR